MGRSSKLKQSSFNDELEMKLILLLTVDESQAEKNSEIYQLTLDYVFLIYLPE